jgi:hypothetical protein
MTDTPTFKDFLYGKNGYYRNLAPDPTASYYNAMMKADVPLTYSTSTTWFDPLYLGKVTLEALTRSKKAFSALRKTSYASEGDSYQVIDTDVTHQASMLETGALFGTTAVPALADVDTIYPAILHVDWTNTEVATAMSGLQRSRTTPTLEQIREYMTNLFWDTAERQICGVWRNAAAVHGVDSIATTGGVAEFECIDRMISTAAETGANYVNDTEDGDIWWDSIGIGGGGTEKFDRSAGEGVAQTTIPVAGDKAAGTAYNICDELDDLMAKILVYCDSDTPNYIAMMSPKAYNKVKAENDPKALITDYTDARQTINGISSAPGVVGGKVQLSALRLSDITVPIVTVPYLMGTAASSWTWLTTVCTTGTVGNIYLINQDAMEFRTLIPLTYRSVPAEDALETKHTLYMAGQLVCKNWMSHGALKLIKA